MRMLIWLFLGVFVAAIAVAFRRQRDAVSILMTLLTASLGAMTGGVLVGGIGADATESFGAGAIAAIAGAAMLVIAFELSIRLGEKSQV